MCIFLLVFKTYNIYNTGRLGVIQGSKTIYMPIMPGHSKRLGETMIKLLKKDTSQGEKFVDLFITYAECDKDESRDRNNLCPPIRYYF
jgi:ubiquitin-activating enzyme E1-like protein 2